ncbi:MAG: hypothetical protein JRL30_11455 [Deltaproteobacteria bacterium]|nr:hypothetical protein [Deltaproteobacteria bacterium]
MYKKIFLIVNILCLAMLCLTFANAKEYTIGDYDFSWRVAKAGDVGMDVQKNPKGVSIVLRSPGGGLARLTMTPLQAVAVGDVLKKTGAYYDEQMKQKDPNMEKQVSAGDHTVNFSSSRGKQFQVSVRKSAAGAAVLMNREQALKMGKYMSDAEKMAALVNERIRP